jgi:hypothetical protein
MCDETKRSFAEYTTEDIPIPLGAMYDQHLEQLEELTAIVYLHAKATIAAALIRETGVGDQEGVAWIGQRAEQVMAELTKDPPPAEPKGGNDAIS